MNTKTIIYKFLFTSYFFLLFKKHTRTQYKTKTIIICLFDNMILVKFLLFLTIFFYFLLFFLIIKNTLKQSIQPINNLITVFDNFFLSYFLTIFQKVRKD